jgi:hypothetical protein
MKTGVSRGTGVSLGALTGPPVSGMGTPVGGPKGLARGPPAPKNRPEKKLVPRCKGLH